MKEVPFVASGVVRATSFIVEWLDCLTVEKVFLSF